MAAVLIASPLVLCPSSIGTIAFASAVLRQSQERLFQTGARDLQAGKVLVAREQFANNRLGFDCVQFHSLAIFSDFGNARDLTQGGQAEAGDATNPFAGSLRLNLCGSSLRNDLALADDSNAV